uniref:Protein sco1 n=1 Tax=Rhizophora mucronata TaxID=61149 RepID=A0A2P2L077_RHIMU
MRSPEKKALNSSIRGTLQPIPCFYFLDLYCFISLMIPSESESTSLFFPKNFTNSMLGSIRYMTMEWSTR